MSITNTNIPQYDLSELRKALNIEEGPVSVAEPAVSNVPVVPSAPVVIDLESVSREFEKRQEERELPISLEAALGAPAPIALEEKFKNALLLPDNEEVLAEIRVFIQTYWVGEAQSHAPYFEYLINEVKSGLRFNVEGEAIFNPETLKTKSFAEWHRASAVVAKPAVPEAASEKVEPANNLPKLSELSPLRRISATPDVPPLDESQLTISQKYLRHKEFETTLRHDLSLPDTIDIAGRDDCTELMNFFSDSTNREKVATWLVAKTRYAEPADIVPYKTWLFVTMVQRLAEQKYVWGPAVEEVLDYAEWAKKRVKKSWWKIF